MTKIRSDRSRGGGKLYAPPDPSPLRDEQQHPTFSLQYVQNHWCITDCSQADRAAFASVLRRLSQLSWAQIHSSPRHGLGYARISRDAIRPDIPGHISPDANLIAFRFSGLKSMVGYRENATFYCVWFDPDRELYDHGD